MYREFSDSNSLYNEDSGNFSNDQEILTENKVNKKKGIRWKTFLHATFLINTRNKVGLSSEDIEKSKRRIKFRTIGYIISVLSSIKNDIVNKVSSTNTSKFLFVNRPLIYVS